jgi:S1-C subfamily serine protease
MDLETALKEGLKDIESFRTPDCPDVTVIGGYAEQKLDAARASEVEEHLKGCIYCLKQLNDITEMLYYEKHPALLSPRLQQKLREALRLKPAEQQPTLWDKLASLLTVSPQTWRYAAIGLAAAWGIFLVNSYFFRPSEQHTAAVSYNHDAFVKVQALSGSGTVMREQQGVVVDTDGLIAANLTPLAGAARVRITFKDGSTREIHKLWIAEERNLVVMKTDVRPAATIPLGEISEIVGKKIYLVADPNRPATGVTEAVAGDIRELSGRRKDGGLRYLQIVTQTTTATKGAVIDSQGRLIGFLITEEQHINYATPSSDVAELMKNGKPIPVSELKTGSFSGDALNAYMKGLLANEANRWDEAISHLQKAVKLNRHLEGAFVALGYAYFRKHDLDKERDAYLEALKLNPNDPDALYSLAWNMQSRGNNQEAIPLYEKALTYAPEDDTELIYQLGLSYLAQGRKDRAMEMYGRLRKYDQGLAELLKRLITR